MHQALPTCSPAKIGTSTAADVVSDILKGKWSTRDEHKHLQIEPSRAVADAVSGEGLTIKRTGL
jgi:hypothetical protein